MTPLHLIIGLPGSGKTTLLRYLLQHRPADERWGVLVNDFGATGIDGALLPANRIIEVAGGCLCCSAQLGLQQGINRLLQTRPERIFIEASGASHPQPLALSLSQVSGARLTSVIAVVTPLQLTPDRWQRAERLRMLVTLADHVVLNKVDLADAATLQQAVTLLDEQPAIPVNVLQTRHGQVTPAPLLQTAERPLQFLPPATEHAAHTRPHAAMLPGLLEATISTDGDYRTVAYRFRPEAIFNRTLLNRLLPDSAILRAKGLLRTGMAWNLLQFSDGQRQWTPHGWRLDSRLVLFWPKKTSHDTIKQFENRLKTGITLKD